MAYGNYAASSSSEPKANGRITVGPVVLRSAAITTGPSTWPAEGKLRYWTWRGGTSQAAETCCNGVPRWSVNWNAGSGQRV